MAAITVAGSHISPSYHQEHGEAMLFIVACASAPCKAGRSAVTGALAEFLIPAAQPFERLVVAVARHALVAADAVAPIELAVDPLVGIGRAALLQRLRHGFHSAGQLGSLLLVDRLLWIEPQFERDD